MTQTSENTILRASIVAMATFLLFQFLLAGTNASSSTTLDFTSDNSGDETLDQQL